MVNHVLSIPPKEDGESIEILEDELNEKFYYLNYLKHSFVQVQYTECVIQ